MAGRTGKALTVTLTKQMAARVKERVASGEYASESEVIRHGLRLLEERSSPFVDDIEHWLRTEGVKRAKAHAKTPENVISAEEMRKQMAAHIKKRRMARK